MGAISLLHVFKRVQVRFRLSAARHGRRERVPLPTPLLGPHRPATVMGGRPHARGGVLEPTCGSARRERVRWRVWGRMGGLDTWQTRVCLHVPHLRLCVRAMTDPSTRAPIGMRRVRVASVCTDRFYGCQWFV
jgi:hypothetical protein